MTAVSMWLQTRNVRHLVITHATMGALCGATPRMWFDNPAGDGAFVFSGPRSSRPADMSTPLCRKCIHVLTQLNQDAR